MRVFPRVAGALVLVLAAFAFTPGGRVQAQPRSGSGPHFWLVTTGDESFTQAVRQAVQMRMPGGQQVVPTLEEMLKRVSAGHVMYVPEGTWNGPVNVPVTVSELRAAISAARSAASATARRLTLGVTGPALSPLIGPPQQFPVVGNGCNPYIYNHIDYFASWCDMKPYLQISVCDPGCQVFDKISTDETVDPGSLTSRVSYTSSYFPDSHDFTDIHFEWWTLCYRNAQTCANDKTNNFSGNGSGTFSPDSPNLHNDMITVAFAIEALFLPNGTEYGEGVKTPMGYCLPQSTGSNQCLFPVTARRVHSRAPGKER